MRRMTAAAVAATTALSLVATPAMAQENTKEESSFSDLSSKLEEGSSDKGSSDKEGESSTGQGSTVDIISDLGEQSSKDGGENSSQDFLGSSLDNDKENEYEPGTTADILAGTGIAALLALLAGGFAYTQGLIKLPF